MSKIFKISTIIFGLLLCTSCSGGNQNDKENNSENGNNEILNDTEIYKVKDFKKISYVNDNKEAELLDSYKDYDTNYWFFKVGRISNVPLNEIAGFFEFKWNGSKFTKQFETSEVETETITNSVTNTINKSVQSSETRGSSGGFTLGKKDVFNIAAEMSYQTTISHNETKTMSSTYSDASQFSKSKKDTISIEFNEKSKNGFYGYLLFGNIDVYALLTENIETKNKEVSYYSDIVITWNSLCYFEEISEFSNYEYDSLVFNVPSRLETPNITKDPFNKENPIKISFFDGTKYTFNGNTRLRYGFDLKGKWDEIEKYKTYGYTTFVISTTARIARDYHWFDRPSIDYRVGATEETVFETIKETFAPTEEIIDYVFTNEISIDSIKDRKMFYIFFLSSSILTNIFSYEIHVDVTLKR